MYVSNYIASDRLLRRGAYGPMRCGAYGPMLFFFTRSVGLQTNACVHMV